MASTSTLPQLLTIDQLAEQLGITTRHVRRLIAERRVPYLKVGKLVRFDPAEIADWLDDRRVTCGPEPAVSRPGATICPASSTRPFGRPPRHSGVGAPLQQERPAR